MSRRQCDRTGREPGHIMVGMDLGRSVSSSSSSGDGCSMNRNMDWFHGNSHPGRKITGVIKAQKHKGVKYGHG